MDKVDVCQSYSLNLPARDESLYPMCVGVNCAFLALEFLSKQEPDNQRWSELSVKILQGSAHLLGLLVWRVRRRPRKEKANTKDKSELLSRLEAVEKELQELKRIRREDGKANQRVTSIYASQEQNWFTERKKLRQQIGGLMNELRILEKRKDGVISELQEKLRQKEVIITSKDKNLEEEGRKKKELEEEMKKTAGIVEELKEKANHESQSYASEIWKHKTAFIELISNQRQIESEMGRALRQAEAAKQQLEYVFEEKEESLLMIQKLSIEIGKLRKDCEQKDKILSAVLRKSKSDTAERQVLLTEIKFSKAKRKKAELETEKWRLASETRNERHTLKSMFLRQVSSRFEDGRAKAGQPAAHCMDPGIVKDTEEYSPESDHISPATHDELSDAERVESWVRAEAEKYQTATEQKQQLELEEAFAEQMRLKDDKLEAYGWRLLSMEIESKRLHSQVEGLNQGINQLRHENMKLEAMVIERESELKALKDQIALHLNTLNNYKLKLNSPKPRKNLLPVSDDMWSDFKLVKKMSPDKDRDVKNDTYGVEGRSPDARMDRDESGSVSTSQSSIETVTDVKEFSPETPIGGEEMKRSSGSSAEAVGKDVIAAVAQCLAKKKDKSAWKMDIHALGVSYKIKRLKQQLLMLERLTGKKQGDEESMAEENQDGSETIKGSHAVFALLSKQVGRYQSLQEKIDQLCKRMHEKDLDVIRAEASSLRKKEETRTLEHFLEETFQLQRFMVATGQKLMEIQSKVVQAIAGVSDSNDSTDLKKRFADNIQTLFKEVQRGLEVRIAKNIGDLEGTLACDGIHFGKHK